MRIERLNFRNFETDANGAVIARSKTDLPGGGNKEEAPPPPPEPTFSADDLKEAERESYKKGFLEGTEEGKNQAENEQVETHRNLTITIENFVNSTSPLLDDYRLMITQLREDIPKVGMSIAKKVAGKALEENAQRVVNEMALACAELMINEPKLNIKVNSCVAAALETELKELAAKTQSATDFVVTQDDTLQPNDCKVEWKYGAMERHTGELWQEVEKIIESMVTSAKREADQQVEQIEQQLPKE